MIEILKGADALALLQDMEQDPTLAWLRLALQSLNEGTIEGRDIARSIVEQLIQYLEEKRALGELARLPLPE